MSDPFRPDRRTVLAGLASVTALACVDLGERPGTLDDTAVSGDTAVGTWATGGTASLAAAYAVTFDDTCVQECELTLGPCYAETIERRDISEGVDGLPMRLAFRVVDTDCNPVAGVVVDVWHCSPSGLYSGADAATMCTDGDSEARAGRWFRGMQTTDADGRVDFDTCMPGWYSGRAVHIHFQVRTAGGQASLTSQFGFDPTLLADVFANHPVYSPHGQPDTPNAQDNIFRSNNDGSLIFDWYQADDGALVVYKTLVVRADLSDPTC
ncbi:MAG: protocatechuate 3,4-dioxygenase [Alphaproteobacteria bacterium]|nr:protocatechuate 3,4-dioxygenase [Alphaproteobacteria bacterium]